MIFSFPLAISLLRSSHHNLDGSSITCPVVECKDRDFILVNFFDRDYLKGKKFGGEEHGTTKIRKTKKG